MDKQQSLKCGRYTSNSLHLYCFYTGQYNQPARFVQVPPTYNVQQAYSPAGQPVAPAPYTQAPGAPYNQASGAPYNQAPGAPYNHAPGRAPYNQSPIPPYNQQAASAQTKPGEVVD